MPDEFITQRVDIANPPTLMLVIERLLDRTEENEKIINKNIHDNNLKKRNKNDKNNESNKQDNSELIYNEIEINSIHNENQQILSFLNDVYPALDSWIDWFRNSQKGPESTDEEEGYYFFYL